MRRLFFLAVILLSGCFVDAFAPADDGGGGAGEGASGAGASGAGGTDPTGGAPTGGAAPTETICDDGVDQDDDGLFDCDDPDCSVSSACPGGWQVVTVEVVSHDDPSSAPCDGPTELRFSTPNTPDCTPCGCTTTATCTSPTIACWFSNNTCTGQPNHVTAMATGCSPGNLAGIPGGVNPSGSCQLTAPSILATECVDSGSSVGTEDAVAEDVHVCANVPANVPTGERCLRRAGEHTCPAGYTNERTIFADYVDDRSCACDCTSTCAGGSYIANDNVGCVSNNNPGVSVLGTACTLTPSLWDSGDGTLTPIPGVATSTCAITETGAVTPMDVATLCCPG
jgi:hypothetical protein